MAAAAVSLMTALFVSETHKNDVRVV